MKINVNDYVRVKLTSEGMKIHLDQHRTLLRRHPKVSLNYSPPQEDAEGWSEWQLWQLMQTFGPHITMGFRPPFETTIEIGCSAFDRALEQTFGIGGPNPATEKR